MRDYSLVTRMLNAVKFNQILIDLPSEDRNYLSTDKKYLLHIYQSISEEKRSSEMALKNPGKMLHSR